MNRCTIAIPFYNPGESFEWAIRSVFAQTVSDWELLLIDDGSSDGSADYARSIRDKRVRVISDGARRGLSYRLNQSIDVADTDLYFRMDSDDMMHPRRIEIQREILSNSPANTVCGSAAYYINKNNIILGGKNVMKAAFENFKCPFIHPTVATRLTWLRKYKYTNNPLYYRCEDFELWFRARSDLHVVNLPERLLYYRESGSKTRVENMIYSYAGLLGLSYNYYNGQYREQLKHTIMILTKLLLKQTRCILTNNASIEVFATDLIDISKQDLTNGLSGIISIASQQLS